MIYIMWQSCFKDSKVEHISKDIQIVMKMSSRDLEMIDLELHRMTSPSTKFKHTNVGNRNNKRD